ncbi:MAG: hypothetical protein QOI15_2982, partial [Pseudonocardiales bacterium]|nr:hypothetical protein [Pseudonocardiales bacterium]
KQRAGISPGPLLVVLGQPTEKSVQLVVPV